MRRFSSYIQEKQGMAFSDLSQVKAFVGNELYHGTDPQNIPSVLTRGLFPQERSPRFENTVVRPIKGGFYVGDWEFSLNHGYMGGLENGNEGHFFGPIIAIPVDNIGAERLNYDPELLLHGEFESYDEPQNFDDGSGWPTVLDKLEDEEFMIGQPPSLWGDGNPDRGINEWAQETPSLREPGFNDRAIELQEQNTLHQAGHAFFVEGSIPPQDLYLTPELYESMVMAMYMAEIGVNDPVNTGYDTDFLDSMYNESEMHFNPIDWAGLIPKMVSAFRSIGIEGETDEELFLNYGEKIGAGGMYAVRELWEQMKIMDAEEEEFYETV